MSYLGTVSVTDDGYFYETNFDGNTEKISVESAEVLTRQFIEAHKDAITINEVTLNHIKEEKRLALTSDEQRLFNLAKLVKFNDWPDYLGMYLEEKAFFAVRDGDTGIYRKSNAASVSLYDTYTVWPETFSSQDRKMMINVLCQIYNKSPGELADYIEEQRRPKAWPRAWQGMKVKHLPTGLVYIVTRLYEKTWLNNITEGNVYAEPVVTGYISFTLGDLLKSVPNASPKDWKIVQ